MVWIWNIYGDFPPPPPAPTSQHYLLKEILLKIESRKAAENTNQQIKIFKAKTWMVVQEKKGWICYIIYLCMVLYREHGVQQVPAPKNCWIIWYLTKGNYSTEDENWQRYEGKTCTQQPWNQTTSTLPKDLSEEMSQSLGAQCHFPFLFLF